VNFLADESIDRQIVDRLRQDGHAVRYVAEMEPGISDDIVLDLAHQEADVLLTADKDFGELVFRQGRLTSGILLVRLAGLSPARKAEILAAAISQHGTELPGAFAVLAASSLRIRQLR
jgi:predicted nuclease of predicted toxin-antitoxin system